MGANLDFALTANTYFNARADYRRRRYPSASASSKEYAASIGLFSRLGEGIEVNALLSQQKTLHDSGNFLSQSPRQDTRRMGIFSIANKNWQVGGFYPELMYKHTFNNSNIDFYQYRQNEYLLNFKKTF